MQFVAWHGLSPEYRTAVSGHSPWGKDDADATPIAIQDIAASDLDATLKATILGEDIHAVAFIPLVVDGTLIGKFMAYFRQTYAFTGEDLAVALTIARQLGFAIQRQRSQAELAEELAATRCLQALSVEIAHEADLDGLYEKLVDAAKLIMHSDFASMQEYHPNRGPRGELRLLAFRGFSPAACEALDMGECGLEMHLRRGLSNAEAGFAMDVEKTDFLAGSKDLAGYLETGIHAVQSTPLLSRSGQLVGMISTHWKEPHESTERDLRLFDILAQAGRRLDRAKIL